MSSPFDNDPAPEAAPEPAQEPAQETPLEVIAGDQNYATAILKGGKGYGAPSISVRGGNIPDALDHMRRHKEDLRELMELSARAAIYYAKLVDGDPQQPTQQKPEPQKQAPGGETQSCKHGAMVFKSGFNSEKNKSWSAFFCPSEDRNQQCKPEWR